MLATHRQAITCADIWVSASGHGSVQILARTATCLVGDLEGRFVLAGELVDVEAGEGEVQRDASLAFPVGAQRPGQIDDRAIAASGAYERRRRQQYRTGDLGGAFARDVEQGESFVPVALREADHTGAGPGVHAEQVELPAGLARAGAGLVECGAGLFEVADLEVERAEAVPAAHFRAGIAQRLRVGGQRPQSGHYRFGLARASSRRQQRGTGVVRPDPRADAVTDLDRLTCRSLGLDVASENQRDAGVLGEHANPECGRWISRDEPEGFVCRVERLLVDLFAERGAHEREEHPTSLQRRRVRRQFGQRVPGQPQPASGVTSGVGGVDGGDDEFGPVRIGARGSRRQFEGNLVVLHRLLRGGDPHRLVAGADARDVGGVEIV